MRRLFPILLIGTMTGIFQTGCTQATWYENLPTKVVSDIEPKATEIATNTIEPGPALAPTETEALELTATPVLHNPTFSEMIDFLNKTTVNWNRYENRSGHKRYVCLDYSCDFQRDAYASGLRCAVVFIEFPEEGHVIVAFETTDNGLIYIEPQSDHPMKVEVGRKYWAWVAGPNYDIDYDDTIVDFELYWDPPMECSSHG